MTPRGHLAPHNCSLQSIRTVVIGSALDAGSDEVVGAGLALARAAGARVFLVHAADFEPPVPGLEIAATEPPFHGEQAAWERQLAEQIHRLGIAEAELVGSRVVAGAPHRVISEAARESGAEIIVVGATRGEGAVGKLLGSTADRVVRKAFCPVLVVRGKLAVPPRRVLVPVDLSTLSGDAFHCGLHFLAQIAGETAIEVRAIYVLSFLDALAYRHRETPPVPATDEEVHRLAEADLRRFLRDSQVDDEAVEMAVLPGDPRVEILAELERRPADLVIMGTHGRGGFDRFLIGSVASTVAREAPCSLLLVPPEAALAEALADAVVARTTPAWHVEGSERPARTGEEDAR
jgi:nucleotide-binding universal stress UspA family protein